MEGTVISGRAIAMSVLGISSVVHREQREG